MSHDSNGIPLDFGVVGTSPPIAKEPKPARKVPHCAIRAKERYGIDLSWRDVEAITKRCQKGEGKTSSDPNSSRSFHLIVFGQRVLWVVYIPPAPPGPKHGVVVTVMPPEIGAKLAARDFKYAKSRKLKRGFWRATP